MPSYSGVWSLEAQYQAIGLGNWPSPPAYGYFAGGNSTATGYQTNIDYIVINTSGSGTSFGNLSASFAYAMGCSSSTRGVIAGGLSPSGATSVNTMNYITLTTSGNSSSFGQLSTVKPYQGASCSNSTRGIFAGGEQMAGGGKLSSIQYVTIATTGNSTLFGSLKLTGNDSTTAQFSGCSSTTRGVFAGGNYTTSIGGISSLISYITIATTGNTTDFGYLSAITCAETAFSNATRGIFAGGNGGGAAYTSISYITIASTGNSTAFGTLYATGSSGFYTGGVASSTYGVFGMNAYDSTAMQYLTITTLGNSLLWGNLTQSKFGYAPMSTGHGGL